MDFAVELEIQDHPQIRTASGFNSIRFSAINPVQIGIVICGPEPDKPVVQSLTFGG